MSEELQATGAIVNIAEVQNISATFKKRDIVIKIEADDPKYNQEVLFQMIQDKCDVLDSFQVGQVVTIGYNLKGRMWTNPTTGEVKWFNTLQGWKISEAAQNNYGQAPAPYQQAPSPAPPTSLLPGTVEDDPTVPF